MDTQKLLNAPLHSELFFEDDLNAEQYHDRNRLQRRYSARMEEKRQVLAEEHMKMSDHLPYLGRAKTSSMIFMLDQKNLAAVSAAPDAAGVDAEVSRHIENRRSERGSFETSFVA